MNSKKLGLLVILLALFAILFVACNSDVTDNSVVANGSKELVYATFDNSSKGISIYTVVGYKSYDDLYWFYTATKTDSFGTTGQTSDLVPVRVVDNEPAQGLSGRVGPFSQGTWSFTLYAYDDKDKTNLYYQGSTSPDVTLRNGVDNYIPVTVTPQGDYGYIAFYNDTSTTDTYFEWKDDKGGNGALRLDITLKDSNNVVYNCVSKSLTKGTDGKYKIDGRISKTATDDKFAVGVYTATFKVVNPSDSSVVFTSQDLSLRVYGNLETQLKGSLTEIVDAYGYFQVPEQQINVFIATAEAVTQTVNVAPEKYSSSQAQQTTTVKFEAAALDTTNSQHTLKVEVTPIATAATKFDVIGDETAVAGIDFELKKIVTTTVGDVTTTTEQTVETFENQKYATIETYIAKGFNTVTVVYTGTTLDQPIANELATPTNVATVYADDAAMSTHLGYSKASGLLRFKTNHFSEYYVKASVEAINVTTNTVYTTLADAVAAVKNNETIQLIKDVTISEKLIVGSDTDAKNFVLDLNEKTLTGRTNLVHGNLTIKNGTIAGGDKQALNVYGSSSSASDYSVLTVESDVTVTADVYAVCLFGKTYDINGYGAVVNFYGKAITTGDTKNGAIFVSGNLGKNEGLANQNNVINIYGSVTSTTDAALALCGNALVNIYDGAELSGDTAVAVKRGKLVVVGGSIHSTGDKNYPPAANNNGTEMSGAGVSVTSTYSSNGPLAVEISGGLITSANADAVYRAAQTYANDATVSITGGTFSSDPSVVNTETQVDNYVAAGYKSNKIEDKELWTVVKKDRTDESVAAVIKADDSVLYFSTLAEAVDAAEQGETVKLLKDIESSSAIVISKNDITIDGGNHIILYTGNSGSWNFHLFSTNGDNTTLKNVTLDGNNKTISLAASSKNTTYDGVRFVNAANAHYYGNTKGTLTFKNCYTYVTTYSIHNGNGSEAVNILIEDSELHGWNSYGSKENVIIRNCKYYASSDGNYAMLRFYKSAVVENTVFDSVFGSDDGHTITISRNGVVLTMNNCSKSDETPIRSAFFDGEITGQSYIAFDSETNTDGKYTSGTFLIGVNGDTSVIPVADGMLLAKVDEQDPYYWTIKSKTDLARDFALSKEATITFEGDEYVRGTLGDQVVYEFWYNETIKIYDATYYNGLYDPNEDKNTSKFVVGGIVDGVVELEKAFNNSGIEKIEFKDGVQLSKAFKVFEGNTHITTIDFNNLKSLPSKICYRLNTITTVKIPSTVTSIEVGVFQECANLESITYNSWNTTYIPDNFAYQCPKLASFIIPENIESIGNNALRDTALTSVIIPAGVRNIGSFAFRDCEELTNIHIAIDSTEGLTVAQDAFSNVAGENKPCTMTFASKEVYDFFVALKLSSATHITLVDPSSTN